MTSTHKDNTEAVTSRARFKGECMARCMLCLFLAIAVALPGCKTPAPPIRADAADVHQPDFLDNPQPPAHSAAWQWWDDHAIASCTGAVLLLVVAGVLLTGLAASAVLGFIH
jgi:hypothetical protein